MDCYLPTKKLSFLRRLALIVEMVTNPWLSGPERNRQKNGVTKEHQGYQEQIFSILRNEPLGFGMCAHGLM